MALSTATAGAKWHHTPAGVKRCTASKKACPYSTHYETEEAALDTNPRGVNARSQDAYNRPFNVVIKVDNDAAMENGNNEEVVVAAKAAVNLREMSDYARDVQIKTGARPHLTTGVMTVDLKRGKRLVVEREIFGRESAPSARYTLTYWHNQNQYETYSVNLDEREEKANYEQLQAVIQRYMGYASQAEAQSIRDDAVREGKDSRYEAKETERYQTNVKRAYENTIQTLDQVEILSRGSQKVNDYYSIDLFSKENPGTLTLSADCSQSVFQPADVVESLKLHAMQDTEEKAVAIHVSEELPGNEGSWAIARIPEGNWYFSYVMGKENFTHEISPSDADEAGDVVAEILTEKHMKPALAASRGNFVKNLVAEVEPAIGSYKKTMEARQAHGAPKAEKPKEEKTVRDKLFGLFS